jgi:hypothetical protein
MRIRAIGIVVAILLGGVERAEAADAGTLTGQVAGTADAATRAFLELRFGIPDAEPARDDTYGTFRAGFRVAALKQLAVGADIAMCYVAPEHGESEAVFGNPAVALDALFLDTDILQVGAGLKFYVPVIWELEDAAEALTLGIVGTGLTVYEPAYYLPATFTFRPDVRARLRFAGLVVSAEMGLDVAKTFDEPLFRGAAAVEQTNLFLHGALGLGYTLFGIVTPNVEASFSKRVYSSNDRLPPGAEDTFAAVGPGVHVAVGPVLADVFFTIPVTEIWRDTYDTIIGVRVGAAF